MQLDIYMKINSDDKIHNFLKEHSYWYRLLNRDSQYYDKFIKEYKNYNREKKYNKVNDVIENIDMISNVMKMM